MPRQLRVQYPGAVYHVLARGDRREDIMLDDGDREMFVATLAEVCKKTGWQVLAWVLMDNHYHWLICTPEPNLVDGMKWFQLAYTQRFNARHKLWGHLFGTMGQWNGTMWDNVGQWGQWGDNGQWTMGQWGQGATA